MELKKRLEIETFGNVIIMSFGGQSRLFMNSKIGLKALNYRLWRILHPGADMGQCFAFLDRDPKTPEGALV